ncbi:ECF-type sigma factor [bacterium]|nr:ECF-type sigma factor [bacterium]
MNQSSAKEITQILESIRTGDKEAVRDLFPLVYEQLRKMAKAQMARQPEQTLQATALVHEVYLRVFESKEPNWQNRKHFFAVAAEAMRQILVDHARRRASLKRAGNRKRVPLTEDIAVVQTDPHHFLSFDRALAKLQNQDPQMADVVKLRCFAGLTIKEIALALDMSPRNVDRHWAAARAWLSVEMTQPAN